MIDTDQLLAFLDERAQSSEALLVGVHAGLATRIRRGDFDQDPER